MNLTREDLIELTPEALTALTNPGFVKKAQKDLAAGQCPNITEREDGTVIAEYADGYQASLPRHRAIKETDCTCPAAGLCRHKVTLVLAYQALYRQQTMKKVNTSTNKENQQQEETTTEVTYWSPADLNDEHLKEVFRPTTLTQALKLAKAHPIAKVIPWRAENPIPTVYLPMCTVRFFSRHSLSSARCDCKTDTACAHIILALWAFRQAKIDVQEQISVSVEISPPDHSPPPLPISTYWHPLEVEQAINLRQAIYNWLFQIWNEGSAQNLLALDIHLATLREQCSEQGWTWVKEALEIIWQHLQAQHARSSRFVPRQLLENIAQLWGRLFILDHLPTATKIPLRQIVGIGMQGEQALDQLRLISLGIRHWHDDHGDGIDIILADPDTQTLLLLPRYWIKKHNTPSATYHRIAGYSYTKLASSQIVTRTAKRRANGQIDLVANIRQSSLFPLSTQSWETLTPPIRFKRINELITLFDQQLPHFIMPIQAIKDFYVLTPDQIEMISWGWLAEEQRLHAELYCPSEQQTLRLQIPYHHSQAVDIAARVFQGQWGKITGIAGIFWRRHGQIWAQPWTIMTEQGAIVLEAQHGEKQSLPSYTLTAADNDDDTIEQTLTLLIQLLRTGLRHQTHLNQQRLQQQASQLHQQGWTVCAQQLEHLAKMLENRQQPELMLKQLSQLIILLIQITCY